MKSRQKRRKEKDGDKTRLPTVMKLDLETEVKNLASMRDGHFFCSCRHCRYMEKVQTRDMRWSTRLFVLVCRSEDESLMAVIRDSRVEENKGGG